MILYMISNIESPTTRGKSGIKEPSIKYAIEIRKFLNKKRFKISL